MTVRVINLQTGEETTRDIDPSELTPFKFNIEEVKQYRDDWWSSQTVTLSNGAELKVNERTRRDISDTFNAMLNAEITSYDGWNAENGIYDMTRTLFQEYSVLAMSVVKKAFDAFNEIKDNTYTDESWKNDFDNLVDE